MSPPLKFFASLRLTVVLLALSMALIFFGTIDQVEYGIWHTQERYFESFLVVWSYPQSMPGHRWLSWIHLPLPGGYLLGGFLLVNLVAAHFARFKPRWRKTGIVLIHTGLVLLLVGELLTDLLAVESRMPVDEGGRANYSESYRENELALIDRSPETHDRVHSVPENLLKRGGVIAIPDCPLSLRVLRYHPNAMLSRGEAPVESPATEGVAPRMGLLVEPMEPNYAESAMNVAAAFVEVIGPEGPLGVWLVSNVIDQRFPPQTVTVGGRTWEIALRRKRHYHPFEVELIDFRHDKYPGTEIPYNFSSEVMVHHRDPAKSRKALIYMNHPLRYEGLTFYQASFANQDRTSVFQVVRNPGWLLPYLSVLLMGLGMCVQFGMHFVKFLGKRRRT